MEIKPSRRMAYAGIKVPQQPFLPSNDKNGLIFESGGQHELNQFDMKRDLNSTSKDSTSYPVLRIEENIIDEETEDSEAILKTEGGQINPVGCHFKADLLKENKQELRIEEPVIVEETEESLTILNIKAERNKNNSEGFKCKDDSLNNVAQSDTNSSDMTQVSGRHVRTNGAEAPVSKALTYKIQENICGSKIDKIPVDIALERSTDPEENKPIAKGDLEKSTKQTTGAKMSRRHSTMTLIKQQSSARRDSVVVMSTRKVSSFNTIPVTTSGRRVSIAVPPKPKRKLSCISSPITPQKILDEENKINDVETKQTTDLFEKLTITIPIYYTNDIGKSKSVRVDLRDVREAVKERVPTLDVKLFDSLQESATQKVKCQCGKEINVILDKETFPKESRQFQNQDMAPNNVDHTDLQSRRLSIEDVIDSLKSKPYVYECQLTGCKRLGRFAYGENLDVTLSQQDSVNCLLKAIKTFPDRPDLLKTAAKTLAKMTASYEASSHHVCFNEGLPILMKIFRTYGDNVDILLLIMEILGHISLNEDLSEELVQNGIHSEIMATMTRHSDDHKIATQCCFIVGNLVNSVDVAQSLMYVGGVHAIIGTMERFSSNLDVIENGCRTLGCFAMHEEICRDVGNAGALSTVISSMKLATDNISVQECGLWALACLTKTDQFCEEMCKHGGIQIVSSAMAIFEEEVIQEYGCWIISNVTASESVQNVAKAGIFEKLTTAMIRFPDNIQMQQQICYAISQIATEKGIQELLANQKQMQTVVETMSLFPDNPEIQEHCCRIIGNVAVNETFRKTIDCKCVAKPIISAMLTLDRISEVQEYGCMALTNLTANVSENKMRVVQYGGVSAVMNTMREFSSDDNIVLCGLKTLANLMEIGNACTAFLNEDGMVLLSEAMRKFPNSTEIREFICIILSNLSLISETDGETLSKAEDILFQSLDDSSNDPDIHLCICQFYENMVLTGVGCDRFIRLRRISRVISAMKIHTDNMEIHFSACKIIAAVTMYNGKGISIINKEVIHLLVKTMKMFNSVELQTVCCGVLSYVIENNDDAIGILTNNGGICVITDAMRNNINEERLQIVGFMTIESLLRKDCLESLIHDNVFYLTVDIMNKFPDSSEIQLYGCNILCSAKSTVTKEIKEKTVTLVTDIMRRSKLPKDVQISARKCLVKLLEGESEDKILQIKSKIPSLNDNIWDQIANTKHGNT